MPDVIENEARTEARRRYVWPWFVLVAILAAIVLAILWLSVEIERTRRVRDLSVPATQRSP
jgi:hypothetical protein